jgi:hypothetical protein
MLTSLAAEQLDGFYSNSMCNNLSITGPCPVNMKISAPKIGTFYRGPERKNFDVLEKGSNDFG